MKYFLFVIFLINIAAFPLNDQRKLHIFLAGDSTMSIKDPRNYPETGWGMPFVNFWDSSVTVVNKAKNGRSTKTFISEGLWQSIVNEADEGDYVFIQFGHNDEVKEKVNSYTTPDEFSSNLEKFVTEARSKKAIPVLLTPVARRKFDSSGLVQDTHEAYSKLVKAVAAKLQVPLIDLNARGMQLYQQFGVENSRLLFNQLKPGEHPNYPDGKEDNTHFNELGARLIAQIVLQEIRNLNLPLAQRMVKPIKK